MNSIQKKISDKLYFIDKRTCISVILSIYFINFLLIGNFLVETEKMQSNVIDYILYLFNDFYFIFFLSYILISILIFPININLHIDKYIYIRYQSRKKWFMSRIFIISFCLMILIMTIILISLIQLISRLKKITIWTQFGVYYFSNIHLFYESPLVAVIISIVLVYLYLFSLSLISFVSGLFFSKKIFGFFLAITLNLANILIYLNNIKILSEFGFCINTILSFQFSRQISFGGTVFSIFYWLIIIIVTIIWGLIKINNMDLGRDKV